MRKKHLPEKEEEAMGARDLTLSEALDWLRQEFLLSDDGDADCVSGWEIHNRLDREADAFARQHAEEKRSVER